MLRRVYDDMSKKGIGDPGSLVFKWNGLSSRMSVDQKNCPVQVIEVLVDVMRMQHLGRK